jgi:hypothetical protein
MDDTLFFQSLPTNRHTFAQILVDSRTAGPPSPADFVWLKDAYGFVQVNLLAPGFRTSFEWGLPTGWTASGGWRVTDMATEGAYCGSNHTGRRAMAFNNASGCTYSGLGTGTLTSPVITVPCQRDVAFYFWHWSSTRRDYPDFDKRRVMLSVDGGLFFTVYESGARDTGDFDSWKQQRIDLSAYTNRQVQVRFEFQPYYSGTVTQTGWYIDDVEVK